MEAELLKQIATAGVPALILGACLMQVWRQWRADVREARLEHQALTREWLDFLKRLTEEDRRG